MRYGRVSVLMLLVTGYEKVLRFMPVCSRCYRQPSGLRRLRRCAMRPEPITQCEHNNCGSAAAADKRSPASGNSDIHMFYTKHSLTHTNNVFHLPPQTPHKHVSSHQFPQRCRHRRYTRITIIVTAFNKVGWVRRKSDVGVCRVVGHCVSTQYL